MADPKLKTLVDLDKALYSKAFKVVVFESQLKIRKLKISLKNKRLACLVNAWYSTVEGLGYKTEFKIQKFKGTNLNLITHSEHCWKIVSTNGRKLWTILRWNLLLSRLYLTRAIHQHLGYTTEAREIFACPHVFKRTRRLNLSYFAKRDQF